MSNKGKIVGLHRDHNASPVEDVADEIAGAEAPVQSEEEVRFADHGDADAAEDALRTPLGLRLTGWALALLALGWTGFFGWAHRADLAAPDPARIAELVPQLAVPLLLLIGAWFLIRQLAGSEARKYRAIAVSLREESIALEARLASMNSELSLAREFLGNQRQELDSIGRIATDRLIGGAEKLRAIIAETDQHMDHVHKVGETAQANMEQLRGHLPVIATSAKDVTSQIGNAGRTAQGQVQQMIEGFKRINEFGQASERQVNLLDARARETTEALAKELEGITGRMGERAEAISTRLANAVANMRGLLEEAHDTLERSRTASETALRGHGAQLASDMDGLLLRIAETVQAQRDDLIEWTDELTGRMDARRESLGSATGEQIARLSEALDELADRGTSVIEEQRIAMQGLTAEARTLVEGHGTATHDAVTAQITRLRETVEAVAARASDAIAEQRDGLARLSAELAEMVEEARSQGATAAMEHAERMRGQLDDIVQRSSASIGEQSAALAARLADYDARSAALSERFATEQAKLETIIDALDARMSETDARIDRLDSEGSDKAAKLAFALTALGDNIEELNQRLAAGRGETEALIDRADRLRGQLERQAETLEGPLPQSIASLDERGAESLERMRALGSEVAGLEAGAQSLAAALRGCTQEVAAKQAEIARLVETAGNDWSAQAETVETLIASLRQAREDAIALHGEASERMNRTLDLVRANSAEIVEQTRAMIAEASVGSATRLAEDSEEALEAVLRKKTEQLVGQLESAVNRAIGATHESADYLHAQLRQVDELAANLETRVADARAQAGETIDQDFARRVAMLTESLNSASIDVAKIMSNEVTDTAWAAYLRGDRGVFTRRAVRLLDAGEVREILGTYENDGEFREQVNRYIHDFEAMLRNLLATRDGNVIGVTLLSSDMGKLYVALAQAIERLRT